MSLQLRQLCQPKLDGMGLSKYHVRIESRKYHTRNMLIVGECGKALTSISGIEFSRNNPVKAEIEYAVELLEAFLVKHGVDIKAFVQAINNRPKDPRGDIFSFGAKVEKKYDKKAVTYVDEPFTLIWSNNKTYISSTRTVPIVQVQEFIPDINLVKKAREASQQFDNYFKACNIINKLQEKLSKCEI